MILQEQERVFLCTGCSWSGGLYPLLPTLRPSWLLIAQPFHISHLDAWILLCLGGDFQYGTVVSGDFIQALP